MSLSVSRLSKWYGRQQAVKDIAFSANAGEIIGFLGPNGAGKSTTMKIIAGYVAPTSGTVLVCGTNPALNPLKAKKQMGYLPEHNPLYEDMYIAEYLTFIGRLYGLGRDVGKRTTTIMERCGLMPESGKRIGLLSKGYRQRVGLAQALLHNPKVLILDEPTSGLDPNQILEIRKLIKEISVDKTVLFSTHILQEVQALCDRAIVINKGQIVADDRVDVLTHAGKQSLESIFQSLTTSEPTP